MRRRVMHVGWLDYLELNERLLQMVMESSFKPDFVAAKYDGWIVFPYEKSEKLKRA